LNNFVLFGDSYVDPLKVNTGECWSELLARDSSHVQNFGKNGTGPDFSIDLFENYIETLYEGDETFIFFIGFPCRFNFKDIPHPGHAVDVSNIHYWKINEVKDYSSVVFQNWCRENKKSLDFFYSSTRVSRQTEFVFGHLRNISDILKLRMIVFFQDNPFVKNNFWDLETEEEWSVDIPQEVLDLQTKYFSIYPYNIASVSRKEFKTLENDTTEKTDRRQNHLTEPNHVVLYENINSILIQEPTKEHILFREEFDTWFKPSTGFIYDE